MPQLTIVSDKQMELLQRSGRQAGRLIDPKINYIVMMDGVQPIRQKFQSEMLTGILKT